MLHSSSILNPYLRHHAHIDELLGPSSERFFGAGYKNSTYSTALGNLIAGGNGAGLHTGEAEVELKIASKWSVKGKGYQLPHISTTDVIAIALQLSESVLRKSMQSRIGALILREMNIRAPSKPSEGNSYHFKAQCTLNEAPAGHPEASIETTTRFQGFNVQACFTRVNYPPSEASRPDIRGLSFWADGFKRASNSIEDIDLDLRERSATARLEQSSSTPPALTDGIDVAYQGLPSIIDVFVTGMQLGQVLIYELDSVERAKSNTLWMRSLSIKCEPLLRPEYASDHKLFCRIIRASTLPCDETHNWRTVTLDMGVSGVSLQCNVVHKIQKR